MLLSFSLQRTFKFFILMFMFLSMLMLSWCSYQCWCWCWCFYPCSCWCWCSYPCCCWCWRSYPCCCWSWCCSPSTIPHQRTYLQRQTANFAPISYDHQMTWFLNLTFLREVIGYQKRLIYLISWSNIRSDVFRLQITHSSILVTENQSICPRNAGDPSQSSLVFHCLPTV